MTTTNFAAPAILMFSLQPANDTIALKQPPMEKKTKQNKN